MHNHRHPWTSNFLLPNFKIMIKLMYKFLFVGQFVNRVQSHLTCFTGLRLGLVFSCPLLLEPILDASGFNFTDTSDTLARGRGRRQRSSGFLQNLTFLSPFPLPIHYSPTDSFITKEINFSILGVFFFFYWSSFVTHVLLIWGERPQWTVIKLYIVLS